MKKKLLAAAAGVRPTATIVGTALAQLAFGFRLANSSSSDGAGISLFPVDPLAMTISRATPTSRRWRRMLVAARREDRNQ